MLPRRSTLALLLATTGLGLSAAAASAATSGAITEDGSGAVRATWSYDQASNKLCVRTLTGGRTSATVALNGPSRETSPGSWSWTYGDAGIATDAGGDASPSCIRVKARWDGVLLKARGDWLGSGSGHGSMPVEVLYG